MRRNFKIYCKDVSDEGSEFELRFVVDGQIVSTQTTYSFDDVLIISYDFFRENCEKYEYDSRFDELSVDLSYKLS